MKKKYVKAQIVFESFEMSSNIASCGYIRDESGIITDSETGLIVLSQTTAGCVVKVPGGNDGLCYDVPTAGVNLFYS